ncbi:MAG: hypothetical protein ACTSP4_08275 [Candidatus Hodarchaeales archaeon]
MIMQLSEFGKNYLLLGLRIGKIIEGYVDSYFGPPELDAAVKLEKPYPIKELLEINEELQKQLVDQGFEEEREKFLGKMLGAMEASLEIISGKEMAYLEKVNRLYDIQPELVEDELFYNAAEELNGLFTGKGTLTERMNAYRKKRALAKDKLEETFATGFDIVKKRFVELYDGLLPDDEEITIKIVNNEPWSAYNWYLGTFKSRIDVNTDIPMEWTRVLPLVSHEGYPGHHAEHVIKEKLLYFEQGRFEHAILLIQTPEAVISEGLANTGIDVMFSSEEKERIALERICPDNSGENLEQLISQNKAMKNLSFFSSNLAIHTHIDGWTDDQIVKYGMEFGFTNEQRIRQQIKFIRDPLWSTYVFNYSIGESMIKRKYGDHPSSSDFKRFLTSPVLPSDLE